MSEIKCPKCGQVFTVNEDDYAAILNQVRTHEFEQELNSRVAAAKEADSKDAQLRLTQAVSEKEKEIAALNEQLNNLKESTALQTNSKVAKVEAEKDKEITELKLRVQSLEADAKNAEDKFAAAKANALSEQKEAYTAKLMQAKDMITKQQGELAQRDSAIDKMKLEKELDIQKAVAVVEKERDEQKTAYEKEIGELNTSLAYYKDLKTKMSTKMIGETLEQHCEQSFEMYLRPTLSRNVYFEKDNDDSSGSKGDFIYRETDDSGNEIISIMFEMKNEMDQTEKKHKNSDFFAKLDKDRKTKKCEYAVLVSMLEADSELYNQGIVDVSYQFEKMYVIRPQFFIPMITILRNTAMNSLEYKQELANVRNQEIDITDFEDKINAFKDGFSKNYDLANRQFNIAIDEIEKTIDHLKKVKENLTKSLNNLRLANDKAQKQLTIKSLTKDNRTMSRMFDELDQTNGGEG
ncbi:MAG: DUF2130 domain-containing protein [Ruminococcus sp.]|nr:DUF2130 domain-containing protein [Ruminococcus sp.]